jgi:polyhydroxybutyrate depolymerase
VRSAANPHQAAGARPRVIATAVLLASAVALLAAAIFAAPSPSADAQSGPSLTRRASITYLSADQGRLTALPGTACAGPLRTGTVLERQMTSGGIVRSYRLYMPASVQKGQRVPVVLNFHALASNGQIQEDLSGMRSIADREGFILVSPNASGTPSGWNALLNADSGVDDVQFVDDLLDELLQDYCVDGRRIYATGFSSGGMITSRIGCELGSRFAAVAPVAGLYAPADPCVGVSPMLAIHGTNDTVVPFGGGMTVGVPYAGAREGLKDWAGKISRCSGSLVTYPVGPALTLEEYQGCGQQDTGLLVINGLGHAPPNGATADYIWSFFERHTLPFPPSHQVATHAPAGPGADQ